jgi:Acetoacetate decarboxylase (ADC)
VSTRPGVPVYSAGVPFPSPPWSLRAHAWVSVFALTEAPRPDRPDGIYAAAFVDYREGGVLAYHELLVVRLLRDGAVPRVRVTDIWVDSPESLAGGRSLWAIPKQEAVLPLQERRVGPVARTSFRAMSGLDKHPGRLVARGEFTSLPAAALVRMPIRGSTSQVRDDGTTVVARLSGSGRVVPCLGRWTFDADGPLGFLSGRRPLLSAHLLDVRLLFG